MDWNIICDESLAGAVEALDRCVTELRTLQARGIEVSVEQMAIATLLDDTDLHRGYARAALMLGAAIARLSAQ